MSEVKVIEVFGKFATQVDGKVKMFDTRGAAESAAIMEAQADAFQERATAYCVSRELDVESKMAKGKMNVIIDFLAYEAAGTEASAEADTTEDF